MLRALIWTAILLLFAFAFYLVFGRKEEPKVRPAAAITTTTATAQKGNIGDYLDAIGTVTPVYTASIFSQVTGVVSGVNYQEGQLVKKGDRLTDIDDRLYVATLSQAQGALERDAFRPHGRAMPLPSKCWMIRKNWCFRMKAP